MPPPDRVAARDAAHDLGLEISETQADRLLDYVDLLQRWNATYNLTAVRDPAAMWLQHVVDCMAAAPPVRALLPTGRRARILDVGSGGGLPGVVWAVLMPEADVTCIDSVGKKAAFIRQASGSLGLANLQAVHARVESMAGPAFDLITSRAFASLHDFTRLTRHLLASGGAWVALKGRPPLDEVEALAQTVDVFHVEQLRVPGLDAERCLVWLKNKAGHD